MEKKGCLISFGIINKYFIIPFLSPVFCYLSNYFIELYIDTKVNNESNDMIKDKIYLISTIVSLSYFGGGLLYFITYIRAKTKDTKESLNNKKDRLNCTESSSLVNYIYNDPFEQKNVLKIFSILFILSLLVAFSLICGLFSINKIVFEKRLYYLLLLPIFSKIILKTELFRHQFLSLFISIIGIIFLCISKALQFGKIDIIFNISWVHYFLFNKRS